MKIVFIITAIIAVFIVLRAIDQFTNKTSVKSIGAKSNRAYRNIPTINITDEEELKKALDYYKDMID